MVLVEPVGRYSWQIPKTYDKNMQVPVRLYCDDESLNAMLLDSTLTQCVEAAKLSGIRGWPVVLPNGNKGHYLPSGFVILSDADEGVLIPAATGLDINCGTRLIGSRLTEDEVKPKLKDLLSELAAEIPRGAEALGRIKLSRTELQKLAEEGVEWAIERGYGWSEDSERCEENGFMDNANLSDVPSLAINKSLLQLGSMGGGSHFVEVAKLESIVDEGRAKLLGMEAEGQVFFLVHTGSRALGYYTSVEYLRAFRLSAERLRRPAGVKVPHAEAWSRLGQNYLSALAAACNYSWVNRQFITQAIRETLERLFRRSADVLEAEVIFDSSHNSLRLEEHEVEGAVKDAFIHRKAATRSFSAGHKHVIKHYRHVGQPSIILGGLGASSWVMFGAEDAMRLTFASTSSSAGRKLGREEAAKTVQPDRVKRALDQMGVSVMALSQASLSIDGAESHRDVDKVCSVINSLGISRRVAKLRPLAILKS